MCRTVCIAYYTSGLTLFSLCDMPIVYLIKMQFVLENCKCVVCFC